jgi:hypothetical protein
VRRKALAGLALSLVCCDSDSDYLYLGNVYDTQYDCLSTVEALDVEEGNVPDGACGPLCLAGEDLDGDVIVAVSTMCGPPPYGVDISGSNPLCVPAFAALARSAYCLDGGGSSNPLDASAMDAGAD